MASLSQQYPANTLIELTLNDSSTVKGLIYCTDELSQSIVIQRSLVHTTLSSEIIVVHVGSVVSSKRVELPPPTNNTSSTSNGTTSGTINGSATEGENNSEENIRKYGVANVDEVRTHLSKTNNYVSKRALEERERRAMRLADESFSHVNQKATPAGQKIFDKLLKACNEVSWEGQSILVLNHIRVDPPYQPENCTLVDRSGGLDEHSLERVKKIVGVAHGS